MKPLRIGLIGDYNPEVPAHQAIPKALALAADLAGDGRVESRWIATESLAGEVRRSLSGCDGLWCVPASPYASMDGALKAIRFARERMVPFLGTCGGFQHALIEHARNVIGLREAEHAETNPAAALALISRLECSLVEQQDTILLKDGSRIRQIYGRPEIVEAYRCRFGLNRVHETRFDGGLLRFTGRDRAGEVRVFELEGHPFFIGTLFQPERSALRGEHHPLVSAFVQAVCAHVAS